MEEPVTPTLRPCSTPHSAPVAWLKGPEPAPTAVEPETAPASKPLTARRDGWTGERMATFLEVLADTGIVTEACRVAGMSREGVYPLRSRDPVFAAAWRAAQTKARPVLADGLVERSITGTVEHYYRDGVLVGERRHYESWLALAILKRLDKQAEDDRSDQGLTARIGDGWNEALCAIREGGTGAVLPALEPEVDEVDTPPPPGSDPFENCWKAGSAEDLHPRRARDVAEGKWITTFAPPPGFEGYQNIEWDGDNWYERACTSEEAELLDAHQAAVEAAWQAELIAHAQAERDNFFAKLRADLTNLDAAA
ncbi:MAG TPA: hypothetical protein VFW39_01850, partial [Sphingomicrobium sp.]|nr:hypothetical protein [Sphingomicrobium sp.]